MCEKRCFENFIIENVIRSVRFKSLIKPEEIVAYIREFIRQSCDIFINEYAC